MAFAAMIISLECLLRGPLFVRHVHIRVHAHIAKQRARKPISLFRQSGRNNSTIGPQRKHSIPGEIGDSNARCRLVIRQTMPSSIPLRECACIEAGDEGIAFGGR